MEAGLELSLSRGCDSLLSGLNSVANPLLLLVPVVLDTPLE